MRAAARLAGIAALLALTDTAHAQPARADASTDGFCWRGRPLPRCRAFALFELGYFEALATTRLREPSPFPGAADRDEPSFGRQLSWSVGAMRNLGAGTAVGGAVIGGAALNQGPFVAGTVRWRRWTGASTSLELAGGPGAAQVAMPFVASSTGYQGDVWRPAAVAEARANLADLAAVSVRGVVVPRAGGRTHGAVFVGASTGSTAAVIGTAGLGILFGLAIAALGNAY
ncbi:hypothetical protein rosag_01320 [Roseisolibacter agri]|uniref:Uncharacterized protein n=1 Tax=Roseisolibacter agri TaxID=2014610 RepID=A0AA37PZL1_9BACT|nr:hypothetical protein rosag_01320 [Roseisolibacter agri]